MQIFYFIFFYIRLFLYCKCFELSYFNIYNIDLTIFKPVNKSLNYLSITLAMNQFNFLTIQNEKNM